MLDLLYSSEAWMSLLTLTALEVVLGLDNVIFISILASKLPKKDREKARKLGLTGALVSRLALLSVISLIVQLKEPLFEVMGKGFSGKELILLIGGLFLLFKATKEIHEKIEDDHAKEDVENSTAKTLTSVIVQIMLLDLVFSVDSVITAVGLTPYISIMVVANIIALGVMLYFSGKIGEFVEKHPAVKVLALSFLLMIGLVLVAEGWGLHIPKGYVYFAMGFSVFVEMINIKARTRSKAAKK